jgi:ERCC4-type nuclease
LIEGDINKLNIFKDRVDKNTLFSAMVSLNYYKGFSVLRSFNLEETAFIICNMAYKINKSSDKVPYYKHTQEPIISTESEEEQKEQDYCSVVKKVKKENVTSENIGEIMLCQIPGISSTTAVAIINKFKSLPNLILELNKQSNVLKDLTYTNTKGQTRKISKTVIENISKYLSISTSNIV